MWLCVIFGPQNRLWDGNSDEKRLSTSTSSTRSPLLLCYQGASLPTGFRCEHSSRYASATLAVKNRVEDNQVKKKVLRPRSSS